MSLRWFKHADLIGLNLALLLMASLGFALARGVSTNRLELHESWESTKTGVARRVPGAWAFVAQPQSIAGDRLDLSAWYGFQEVFYDSVLDVTRLKIAVRVEPDGYVNVLYDMRDDGFSGIRLSDRTDLPSIQFQATSEGRFTTQTALVAPVRPKVSHNLEIRFAGASAIAMLDGRALGTFPRVPGEQRVGMRGGQRHGWVDDIAIWLADGSVIHEDFSNTRGVAVTALALFGMGTLAFAIGGVLVTGVLAVSGRLAGMWGVLVAFCILIAAGGSYAYERLAPRTYPEVLGDIMHIDFSPTSADRQTVRDSLLRKYGGAEAGDPYRILFLGSSQTWGAGAWEAEDVWVTRLERLLNADGRRRRIECVNSGVSSLVSAQVADFMTDLLRIHPQAAVIDLGNGDVDTASFRASMETMVSTLTRAGIQTVLLKEANSPERRPSDGPQGDLSVKHRITDEVGAAHQVPVIDLDGYLAKRNGTGFLWWDFDHMTSYGQHLTADMLHAELPALLHLP